MALTAGSRLGPYQIAAAIGAGGMGEVYKARDTRLDRSVAIKVLPDHVASDPELKQRFEREAKTLAALSHPHICPVFDVGRHDAVDFQVMEYLEGETLEQRLKKGALTLDQALRLAIEIAIYASGYLLFARNGILFARHPEARRTSGEPIRIADRVGYSRRHSVTPPSPLR